MLKNQYQSTETFPIPSPNGIYKGNLEKKSGVPSLLTSQHDKSVKSFLRFKRNESK